MKWETELRILGIKPENIKNKDNDIIKDIIKKKYKKRVLIYHPDKGKEKNSDKFIKIKNAYDYIISIIENDYKNKNKIKNNIIDEEEMRNIEIKMERKSEEIIYKIRNKRNNKEETRSHKELIKMGEEMYKEKLPIRFIKKRAIEKIIQKIL